MHTSRAVLLRATLLATGCAPASTGRPAEPPAPSAAEIPAAHPAGASSSPPAPADAGVPPAAADPGWQARCAASVDEALEVAAARNRDFLGRVAQLDGSDELSVNFLGFHLHVRRVPPDLAKRDTPGVWQHRAEVLGGYHVMYIKETETLSAGLSFAGKDSRGTEPLARIFQAAIDRCFVAR